MSSARDLTGYEIARVSNNNLGRFSEMAEACLGLHAKEQYFRWKYFENPVGDVIAFEALYEGRPAAFYGVIPEEYSFSGIVRRGYQSMDTMTHPDHQGKGLFVKLAQLTYRAVAESDPGAMLFGIPGSNSFAGFTRRLEWTCVHQFRYTFLPRVFRPFVRLRVDSRIDFRSVAGLSSELRSLLSARIHNDRLIEKHWSPEFFEWRVFHNPVRRFNVVEIHRGGRIVGACVYELHKTARCFLNFLLPDGPTLREVLHTLIDWLFEQTGARAVYTWEPIQRSSRTVYRAAGFLVNPFEKGPYSYRVPLISRFARTTAEGSGAQTGSRFEFQPLMQD